MPLGVKPRDAERSKNFFALGLISWLYSRPTEPTLDWIETRFKDELVRDANRAAFLAGFHFGETTELFDHPLRGPAGADAAGEYTNITGNTALAWGLVAAGQLAKLPVFLGSYPITPASDILHELSKHKHFGVRTRAGRRRDRRRRHGARRGVRRSPRRHHHERSRAWR